MHAVRSGYMHLHTNTCTRIYMKMQIHKNNAFNNASWLIYIYIYNTSKKWGNDSFENIDYFPNLNSRQQLTKKAHVCGGVAGIFQATHHAYTKRYTKMILSYACSQEWIHALAHQHMHSYIHENADT